QAGHYTVTGGVHHHGLYRLRPDLADFSQYRGSLYAQGGEKNLRDHGWAGYLRDPRNLREN
ncbi:MAG: hypothetical protein SPE56_01930, partial [Prevotella sp.]|nr:hypothetical protein [Prevotella sp.]